MKKITFVTFLIILTLVVVLSSCFNMTYVGTPIDEEKITEIKEGITTKKDVLKLLGTPTDIQCTAYEVIFIYKYTEYNENTFSFIGTVGRSWEKSDILTIFFDASGIVKFYTFSKNT